MNADRHYVVTVSDPSHQNAEAVFTRATQHDAEEVIRNALEKHVGKRVHITLELVTAVKLYTYAGLACRAAADDLEGQLRRSV